MLSVTQSNTSQSALLNTTNVVGHGQNHADVTTTQNAATHDEQTRHDCVTLKCMTTLTKKSRDRHLWSQWLKFLCAYCPYESARLDHAQSHYKKKHPDQPGPKRPTIRDVAAGKVRILESWSALACGICGQCFEATPGDAASMLQAHDSFVAHVSRQHRNVGPQGWHVRVALKGLLRRRDVAPTWQSFVQRYGCQEIDGIISGVTEDDYAEWWCSTLKYPTTVPWLERNLPHLLYAGLCNLRPDLALAIELPDFIDGPDGDETTAIQTDAVSGATSLGVSAPSTDTTTTRSYYTEGPERMDTETAATTADAADAQRREDVAMERGKSQTSEAMENDAQPYTDGQVFNNLGGAPALEGFSFGMPASRFT